MTERMVRCVKLGRELPGLATPPFAGELGQRIYEGVSAEAWKMWQAESVIVMNHYGLSMGNPEARKLLMKAMEEYLFSAPAPAPAPE